MKQAYNFQKETKLHDKCTIKRNADYVRCGIQIILSSENARHHYCTSLSDHDHRQIEWKGRVGAVIKSVITEEGRLCIKRKKQTIRICLRE